MYDFIVDYFKITDCNLDGARMSEKATLQNTYITQHSLQASLAGWAVSYPEVGMVMPSSWDS